MLHKLPSLRTVVARSAVALTAALLAAPSFAQTLPAAPSWVTRIAPGTWAEVSLNTLKDVDPERDPSVNPNYPGNAPWHGVQGQTAVIDVWNGGAFATKLGSHGSLILFGGGHDAYYGSEVYAFDLSTQKWTRVTNPYKGPFNWPYDTGTYPDGSAVPPHTYDYVDYDPERNAFVLLKGVTWLGPPSNGYTVGVAHLLDLGTKQWRRSPVNADIELQSGGFSVYDPKRKTFWVESGSGGNYFARFNPAADNPDGTVGAWTNYPRKLTMTDSVAAYDPVHDLFVVTAFRNDSVVHAVDLNAPESTRVTLKEAGTAPPKQAAHGWEWSQARQGFLYYRTGGDVYEFRLSGTDWRAGTWQWSKLTSSSNAITPQTMYKENGVYTRFKVARFADAEIALVVNRVDGPVYAFRIPDAIAPKAPTSLTAQ